MKTEVLKGLRPGAFISHGIGDRHRAEALFIFQTYANFINYHRGHFGRRVHLLDHQPCTSNP